MVGPVPQLLCEVPRGHRRLPRLRGPDPADQWPVPGVPAVPLGAPGRDLPLVRAGAADRQGGGVPVLPARGPGRPGPGEAGPGTPSPGRAPARCPDPPDRRVLPRLRGSDLAVRRAVRGLPGFPPVPCGGDLSLVRAGAADRRGRGVPVLPARRPRRPGPAQAGPGLPAPAGAEPGRRAAAGRADQLRAGPRLGPGHAAPCLPCGARGAGQPGTTRRAAVGRRGYPAVPGRAAPGRAAGRGVPHRPGPGPAQPAGRLRAVAGGPARGLARAVRG